MTRHSIPSLVLVGILTICVPAAATAATADNPVKAIPDSAGVVVRLKNPKATLRKISAFAKQIDPQLAQQVRQLNQMMGVPISNPMQAGVDQKRDWWVAVFPTADGEPTVAFAVPTTNADAMRKALTGKFKFVEYKKWLLYTEDAATAKKIRDRVNGEGQSIDSLIDTELRAVMTRGDLSVFVNVPQIRETYKVQLDAAQTEIEETLKQMSNLAPQVEGLNLEPVFEMYAGLLRGLLQALNDTEGVAVGLSVQTRNINIEEYVKLTGGSPTHKFLQSHKPSEMAVLGKLPADKLAYFGFHGDWKALTEWGMNFLTAMLPQDAETTKQFKEVMAEMDKVEIGSYVGSFGLGDLKGGALRSVVIVEEKPIDKVRDMTRKMSRAMAKMNFGGVKQEVELKEDAEKYGEHSADVMTLKQEIDPELDPMGMQKKIAEVMYGPEGMTTRIVYLPDMVVQTMGGGKDAMTEVLKSLEGGESGGSRTRRSIHQTTRSQLPEKANLLILVDLPGLVADAVGLVIEDGQLPIPIDPETLKQIKLKRSYLGFALVIERQGVRTVTRIPIGQIEGFAKLFAVFQSLKNQPQL